MNNNFKPEEDLISVIDMYRDQRDIFIHDRSLPPLVLKKPILSPIITHNKNNNTVVKAIEDDFHFPEYNFSDINRVIETEPLVARVFDRKIILCIKEGFEIVSKNQKITDYLKKRFIEIEERSGISFRTLVEEAITGLIRHSNHFFVFKRSKKHSSGLVRSVEGRKLEPIAGVYSVPIETVQMRFNKNGHCDAIRQELSPFGFYGYLNNKQRLPIYDNNNFIHFYLYYYGGLGVCPPMLIGVKEDIIALRKIEENMELLLYQYLFPLYHYKVGSDLFPAREYPDGTTEVGRTADTIASLPSEGCVVTSHRHEIEVLGSSKQALDPIPAMEWYKKRILAGVAASALDLGEGDTSNRSTSDTLSRLIVDYCKYVQNQVSYLFETLVFKQLLLESTFGDIDFTDPENKVTLKFKEIDLDYQTKKENHVAQLYTQSMITHDEARLDLGRDILDDSDKENLLKNEEHSQGMEAAKEQAKQKASLSANGTAQGASRSKPSNQHGKKGNSEKRKSSINDFVSSSNPLAHRTTLSDLWTPWNELKLFLDKFPEKRNMMVPLTLSMIREKFTNRLISKYNEGFLDLLAEKQAFRTPELGVKDLFYIKKEITRLFDNIINESKTIENLSSLDYRIVLIETAEQTRSYNLGRLRAMLSLDFVEANLVKKRGDTSTILKTIRTSEDYVYLPPTIHPNSDEIVTIE